jgi:uncharacterized membrane protein
MRKSFKEYLMKTMNGMTYGLFATLIVGVILKQIGDALSLEILSVQIYAILSGLLGAGIGLGIGLSLKKDGLKLVMLMVAGAISTNLKITFDPSVTLQLNNNPVTAYLVVVFTATMLDLILSKKTPFDVLLVPITGTVLALLMTFIFGAPVDYIVSIIGKFIDAATSYAPIPMVIVIAVAMGMILTAPISSVAVAFAVGLNGIAAGAAVVGTTVQMIGFAIQSRKDNSIGMMISVGLGTSMLQFKNIIKKPIIWLPTIISSAIIAPILYLAFGFTSTVYGAGMGSSGLVGPLQTLDAMDYSSKAFVSVGLLVVLAVVITYVIDLIFRKKGLIVKDDLKISSEI